MSHTDLFPPLATSRQTRHRLTRHRRTALFVASVRRRPFRDKRARFFRPRTVRRIPNIAIGERDNLIGVGAQWRRN